MTRNLKLAFLTSTLTYGIAAAILAIFFAASGFSGGYFGRDLVTGLTLMLSEFQWWVEVYYLAFIIPWLGSTLVLALLLYWFNGGTRRRRLFGGLSIFIYYFAIWLSLIIEELIRYGGGIRGDTGLLSYIMFLIWPVVGFGLGYLSAIIVERVLKPEFA